jgi:hypothetical protein
LCYNYAVFACILLIYHKKFDEYLINLTGMHEFSTIILCLIDMQIINKNIFDILFPISFVFARIIIYNYFVINYIIINFQTINIETFIVIFLLNTMNICITIKI